jgi:hypothetical protein
VLVALLAPGMALAGTTTEDVSKKTSDAWKTVKSYTVEKKNEALAYGRKLVRQTDREIKELDRKASQASGEAKTQFQSDMKELKAKRKQASQKLDEMGKATSAAWDDAKDGFADAWKDLQGTYEKAVKKLK